MTVSMWPCLPSQLLWYIITDIRSQGDPLWGNKEHEPSAVREVKHWQEHNDEAQPAKAHNMWVNFQIRTLLHSVHVFLFNEVNHDSEYITHQLYVLFIKVNVRGKDSWLGHPQLSYTVVFSQVIFCFAWLFELIFNCRKLKSQTRFTWGMFTQQKHSSVFRIVYFHPS